MHCPKSTHHIRVHYIHHGSVSQVSKVSNKDLQIYSPSYTKFDNIIHIERFNNLPLENNNINIVQTEFSETHMSMSSNISPSHITSIGNPSSTKLLQQTSCVKSLSSCWLKTLNISNEVEERLPYTREAATHNTLEFSIVEEEIE